MVSIKFYKNRKLEKHGSLSDNFLILSRISGTADLVEHNYKAGWRKRENIDTVKRDSWSGAKNSENDDEIKDTGVSERNLLLDYDVRKVLNE